MLCNIEVRSWPERIDVLVIDYNRAVPLAHYPLSLNRPLADPLLPYEEKVIKTIEAIESDQDYLRAHLHTEENVELIPIYEPRQMMMNLLDSYQISSEDIQLENIDSLLIKLTDLDINNLYTLLCNWHDVCELHLEAGSSLTDPLSWVHRAAPDEAYHFHFLAVGIDNNKEQDEEAYALFLDLVDVSLNDLTLGLVLRWVYFHRSEFADRDMPYMDALGELVRAAV